MQKKTIVTILIIILVGVMVTDFKINGPHVFERFFRQLETESMEKLNNIGIRTGGQAHYDKQGSFTIDVDSRTGLKINNTFGGVNIVGEDRENIVVDYEMSVFSHNEEKAEEYGKKISVESRNKNDLIELFVPSKDRPSSIDGIRVDYTIRAPQDLFLDIQNKHGELNVRNFIKGVKLSNYYKDTRIEKISGQKINIKARYGDLMVRDVNGSKESIYIETAYNQADIYNINRNLDFDASYCEVELNGIKGYLDFNSRYGRAFLEDVGEVDIKSDYTQITVFKPGGSVEANTRYGSLEMRGILTDLGVNSSYTDLKIKLDEELNDYTLNCETIHGQIESSFPLNVEKDNNVRSAEKIEGQGTTSLELYAEHADINIIQ